MTPNGHAHKDTSRLARLLEKMGTLGRISSALNMSLVLEDIYSLMLSALVSRKGLSFSRALLLTYNDARQCFEGRLAMGPLTADEGEQYEKEIRAEESALASIMARARSIGDEDHHGQGPSDEEDLVFDEMFQDLRANAFWLTSFQDAAATSALTSEALKARWAYPQKKPHPADVLYEAVDKNVVVVRKTPLQERRLPQPLDEILDRQFAIIPLKTRKGVRAIILADGKFHAAHFDSLSVRLLEWFRIHSALALENAELFNNLTAALEGLQELDRLKSAFLSITSHELRTPLTAMLGFCELLLSGSIGPLAPRQQDMLQRAVNRGGLLHDMINDILEIAELEAGGLIDLDLSDVDPLSVFMSILPRLETRRSRKNVTIEPHLSDGTPRLIRSNEKALQRIFFHLIDNAIKFSEDGQDVAIHFLAADDHFVVRIVDQGIGIPPDKMERIFDSFYQVDQRLTRRHDGIGLGLTITRKLVHALDGTIDLESEPDKGTTVSLAFPARTVS